MVGEFLNKRTYSIAAYHFLSQHINFPSLCLCFQQYCFWANIVLNSLLFSLLVHGNIQKLLIIFAKSNVLVLLFLNLNFLQILHLLCSPSFLNLGFQSASVLLCSSYTSRNPCSVSLFTIQILQYRISYNIQCLPLPSTFQVRNNYYFRCWVSGQKPDLHSQHI